MQGPPGWVSADVNHTNPASLRQPQLLQLMEHGVDRIRQRDSMNDKQETLKQPLQIMVLSALHVLVF